MKGWGYLVIIALIVLALEIYRMWQSTNAEKPGSIVGSNDYQKKYLLTKYEWKNYQSLKTYAAGMRLIICPKIRLADLVEPKKGKSKSEWQKLFNRIKSKHVDFVLCDQDMHVKLIVELDDSSHDREDRQNRDTFVDAALTSAGYKIVHITKFDDAAVAAIDAILNPTPPAGESNPAQLPSKE